jgi:acetoin utilization protein AcuC
MLVYGPRSTDYDFGPTHPLTPRRFGPGISLLEALGAVPNLAPEPASDEELAWIHERSYIELIRVFGEDPGAPPRAGIGPGDTPAFAGMHEASAAVAGGSLGAIEAILRGEVLHAFQPGGGLHHAMPARASGFCVYNDPALAVARARRDGLRVLYVDLDVHHGDGVQAIHWPDPGVMTVSIHETGRALFPGSGFPDELGGGEAVGTKVNLPLEPWTGERGWLAALELVLPRLAEAFQPEVVVSQHGADAHAFDPLAHLNVTTTAMGAAARLVDGLAHEYAGGRWLATGGGGYDVYRVVPRAWAHVWLAANHAPVPDETPAPWRERWAADAERYGQSPMPTTFDDPPNAGLAYRAPEEAADARASQIAGQVLELVLRTLEAHK